MASVIEGFLVSLGFEIDKDAYARFNASVEAAGKRMRGFATKTVAATTALTAAWMKTSSEISKSYQLSQTTGASIKGISALRLAIEHVGGSAGALDQTLQEMSTRLLAMPGYAEQIQSVFGVSMVDATGKTRDMADVLVDIAKSMQAMDPAMAASAASATGLGAVWQALIDKRFPLELERARAATADLGAQLDASAQSSASLMNAFTEAFTAIKMSAMALIGDLNAKFDISGWIREKTAEIPKATKELESWTSARSRAAERYWEEIKKDKWTIFNVRRFGEILDEEKAKEAKENPSKPVQSSAPAASSAVQPKEGAPSGASQGAVPQTVGFRNKNPGNLRGKDGNFRTFATFEEGFRAMATQLKMYQNAGAKNIRDIVSTYAPSSENNTESYISSVVSYLRKEFGVDIDDSTELDLSSPKMLATLVRAMIRQENGAGADTYFRGASFDREAQAASQAQQKSRAFNPAKATQATAAPVTLNQQIYVTGQGAAEKIASATNEAMQKAESVRRMTRGIS